MANTATLETLVDPPRGLVIMRYPSGFRSTLRKRVKRLIGPILRIRSAGARASYGDVAYLLDNFLHKAKSVDRTKIPFDILQNVIKSLESINQENQDDYRDVLSRLHSDMLLCFNMCELRPSHTSVLEQHLNDLKLPTPTLREVAVVLKSCTEVTSECMARTETVRDDDDLQFLLQRLTATRSATLNKRVYLQERRRHRWTKSGIQWRLLESHEKFGDLPPRVEDAPMEVFLVDRDDDYIVAVVGHDPYTPDPPRDDFALIIAMATDVDAAVEERLPDIPFKYRRAQNSLVTWGGTPASTGMSPFDCDLHVVTR